MKCPFNKAVKPISTHYVGITGNEYPIEEYTNGSRLNGKKELPLNEYPYTYKYKYELIWECCKHCLCDK